MAGDLEQLTGDVRASWQRFLDVFEPLRPDLYRYCRHLTHSPWDAEDLVQEVMTRAFVTLGTVFGETPNPRAWLFRVASNSWVDRVRRGRYEGLALAPNGRDASQLGMPAAVDDREVREAAGTLLAHLPPQERAALVLKDVFDFSLIEIAEVLSTSEGAIKAALHRGRSKLSGEPSVASEGAAALSPTLDAFCRAFNARDLERLTSLLLDGATVEIVGLVTEYGRDAPKDPRTGSFAGTLSPLTRDERGGVGAEHLSGYMGTIPWCEVRAFRAEHILLFWYEHDAGPAVRTIMRVELEGDQIAQIRNYFFSVDVIRDVCSELAVPYRTNGYRYW